MSTSAFSVKHITFGIIALAILALLFGLWMQHNLNKNKMENNSPVLASGTVFPKPRLVQPFNLVDDKNQPFTNKNLQGHWSLLFFGFTHCPELCPTTLSILNQAYQLLEKQGQKPLPRVVFISVDPERDTASVIAQYVTGFNKNFIGATGTAEQMEKLTQNFSVLYMKVAQPGDTQAKEIYNIDHSGTVSLIDPQGQLYAIFTMPHSVQNIAQDLQNIIKKQQQI